MRITSVSKNEGIIGEEVILKGEGLGADVGMGSITFNGVLAKSTKWESDEIRVHVPAGAVTGPLTVAFRGQKAEVQFMVNTIPHGKERTFQAIETGHQQIHRQGLPLVNNMEPIPSANPEATDSPMPLVSVEGTRDSGNLNEEERTKERETRVIQPPADGHLLVDPQPAVGKPTIPIVVSGPQSADPPKEFVPSTPIPQAGKIVAPVVLPKEQQDKIAQDRKVVEQKVAPVVSLPVRTQAVGNLSTDFPEVQLEDMTKKPGDFEAGILQRDEERSTKRSEEGSENRSAERSNNPPVVGKTTTADVATHTVVDIHKKK